MGARYHEVLEKRSTFPQLGIDNVRFAVPHTPGKVIRKALAADHTELVLAYPVKFTTEGASVSGEIDFGFKLVATLKEAEKPEWDIKIDLEKSAVITKFKCDLGSTCDKVKQTLQNEMTVKVFYFLSQELDANDLPFTHQQLLGYIESMTFTA